MIVLKFGGSSVKDSSWIDKALDITSGYLDKSPVMISSAMAKTTDRLVDIADLSFKKDKEGIIQTIDNLKKLHVETAEKFLTSSNLEKALEG